MRLCAILFLLTILGAATAAADDGAKGWPIRNHRLEVSLRPADHWLEVTDEILVESPNPQEDYRFLLRRGLRIESLRLISLGSAGKMEYRVLPRWRPRDFWRRPRFRDLGSFGVAQEVVVTAPSGGWDDSFRLELTYAGAVYDSLHAPPVAYSRGFETTSGLIDPRGAYLHRDSFWIPWSSDERFQFSLTTDLGEGWDSVSQGERRDRETRGDRTRTTWVADNPEELVYLVAGPYVVRERQHGDISIYAYTYANTDATTVEPYLTRAGDYIDRYESAFGAYPFAKWALVENWWQTGFGMPSFTLLGDKVIRLPFIVDTSYGHEILHCWWGNGVNVHYEEGNWCEGLTAFGADYTYKLEQSADAGRDYRRDQLRAYLDFASGDNRDFALRDFRERSDFGTQAVGYGKSMMLFHMLRERVGSEVFDRGLKEFYRRWKFRSAAWSDLAAVFSEVTGHDLSSWFGQWVDRPGAVELSLGVTTFGPEGWKAEILQASTHYDAEVLVRWSFGDGDEEEQRVALNGAKTLVKLPVNATSIELDPDFDLYRRLARGEVVPTLGQALGADSTLVVLGAMTDPQTEVALRKMAEQWAANQDMLIVSEADLSREQTRGRSLYLLGRGDWADRVLEEAQSLTREGRAVIERASDGGLSLVMSVRDPQHEDLAWTVLLPNRAEDVGALGRKIPHYSRYSWLLFDRDTNVGKGQWSLVSTPMRRLLVREEQ